MQGEIDLHIRKTPLELPDYLQRGHRGIGDDFEMTLRHRFKAFKPLNDRAVEGNKPVCQIKKLLTCTRQRHAMTAAQQELRPHLTFKFCHVLRH